MSDERPEDPAGRLAELDEIRRILGAARADCERVAGMAEETGLFYAAFLLRRLASQIQPLERRAQEISTSLRPDGR